MNEEKVYRFDHPELGNVETNIAEVAVKLGANLALSEVKSEPVKKPKPIKNQKQKQKPETKAERKARIRSKHERAEPVALPLFSPHDIRNAPKGTVSGKPVEPLAATARVAALMHAEPASRVLPAVKWVATPAELGANGYKCWECGPYYGTVRSYVNGFPIGNGSFHIIGISSKDETAAHDWRDFQQLKNLIAGDEWEAVELYPAESRLADPSNRFYLWCVPKGVFNFGFVGRNVRDAGESGAPQRPFPVVTVKVGDDVKPCPRGDCNDEFDSVGSL